MSVYIRYTSLLYQIVKENDFNAEKIESYFKHDSSCMNKDTYQEAHLYDLLRHQKCSAEIIRLVLLYGEKINVGCSSHLIYLIVALEASRDEQIIELLLKNCTDNNIPDFQPNPVYVALRQHASKGVVQLLLDAGYPLNDSVFLCAIADMRTWLKEEVLHLLIERGLDMNAVNSSGQSVLCSALRLCPGVHDIELLLSAGASLNACTQHSSSLLCSTVARTWEERDEGKDVLKAGIVKLLLDKGAPADTVDEWYWRDRWEALQSALKYCDCEVGAIRLLLDSLLGQEANHVPCKNLLHLVVMNRKCKPDVVQLLIKEGWLVSERSNIGETALHIAAQCQVKKSVIEVLLKNRAEVNDLCRVGAIPFHFAWAKWRSPDIIQLLLAAGSRIGNHFEDALLKNSLDRIAEIRRMVLIRRMSYDERDKLDCCLLFVKYYLLQNPQFDFQGLVVSREEYKVFSRLAEAYVLELQRMESVIVGHNRTLREFLEEHSSTVTEAANSKTGKKNYDFHQLVKKIADCKFPYFFEIISVKVGRQTLKAMLREVEVYTMKCVPDTACIGEEIILNNHCASCIAQYLLANDLLILIVLFKYMRKHTSTSGQGSEENLDNKRSSEDSGESSKHLKLTSELI